eukprot:353172-Chlamydomonas_euryale.AAC.1
MSPLPPPGLSVPAAPPAARPAQCAGRPAGADRSPAPRHIFDILTARQAGTNDSGRLARHHECFRSSLVHPGRLEMIRSTR